MTTSALRYLLTQYPTSSETVLNAIAAGEMDVGKAVQGDPYLLRDFLSQVGEVRGYGWHHEGHILRMAELLEQHGLDPWLHKPDAYKHPFEAALQSGNPGLVRWLGKHPNAPHDLVSNRERNDDSPLWHAEARVAVALLDIGFDPLIKDDYGNTLLHKARGAELATLWLAQGVDPSAKNKDGLDTRAYWDSVGRNQTEAREMDRVLQQHSAIDPDRMLREFGKQVFEIGVPRSRERLALSRIDPATAHYGEYSMPEMVAIEALSRGFHTRPTSYARTGEGNEHRKCRKLLLSAFRACGVNPNDTVRSEWKDTMDLFLRLDSNMCKSANLVQMRTKRDANNKKVSVKVVDNSRNDLVSIIGQSQDSGFLEVGRLSGVLGRLVAAGLVENGSLLAAHLAAPFLRSSGVTGNDPRALAVGVKVARQAWQGNWDARWKSKLEQGATPADNVILPAGVETSLMHSTDGLALVLSTLQDSETSTLKNLANNMAQKGFPNVKWEDPWLSWALSRAKRLKNEAVVNFVSELDALASQSRLQKSTQPVPMAPKRRL